MASNDYQLTVRDYMDNGIGEFASKSLAEDTDQVSQNALGVEANTQAIAVNKADIATNASNISANTTNITTNTTNLTNHESDGSAHGVTGDNVGTLDYCSLTVGGTALLCEPRADSSSTSEQITQGNATVAPAAYNQAQVQSIVGLANDTKAKYNQLETDFQALLTAHNDLLAKLRTAKQLDT